jgi:hypothetical protein
MLWVGGHQKAVSSLFSRNPKCRKGEACESITIGYDLTDATGAVTPGSQTTIIKSVPFSAGTPPVAVTECATAA